MYGLNVEHVRNRYSGGNGQGNVLKQLNLRVDGTTLITFKIAVNGRQIDVSSCLGIGKKHLPIKFSSVSFFADVGPVKQQTGTNYYRGKGGLHSQRGQKGAYVGGHVYDKLIENIFDIRCIACVSHLALTIETYLIQHLKPCHSGVLHKAIQFFRLYEGLSLFVGSKRIDNVGSDTATARGNQQVGFYAIMLHRRIHSEIQSITCTTA